jgi:hypothetical protein
MQSHCRDQRPTSDPGYFETPGDDVGVERCASEAGRLAGFLDAVGELRWMIWVLHGSPGIAANGAGQAGDLADF